MFLEERETVAARQARSTAEDHVIPIHNHPSVAPLPFYRAVLSQSSPALRKVGQVEDGWRMSHSHGGQLEWNLQVAMQVYRTNKRIEAHFYRRDALQTTVLCAMSGQIEGRLQAGHAGRFHTSLTVVEL